MTHYSSNSSNPARRERPPFPGWGAPGAGAGFSRRAFLSLGAAAAAAVALPVTARASVTGGGNAGVSASSARQWQQGFAAPPRSVAPRFRWWWPNGQVDPAEIAREVDEVAAVGGGGLEVSDIHASGLLTLDPVNYGWGSPSWVTALARALSEAERQGMTIDLTLSPGYPVCAPSITPDSPAASTELAHGVVTVNAGGTYSGVVPASVLTPAAGVTKQTLIRVQAVQTTGPAGHSGTPLDQTTLVDLTGTVSDGQITWTAPAGGEPWVLLSYWQRGSGQQPEDGSGGFMTPTPYVVDHFSAIGTQAVTDMWERLVLNDEIRGLLRKAGTAFFEDSLELNTKSTIWTPGLLPVFADSLGYDLAAHLPEIVTINGHYQFYYDPTECMHVRDDVNAVLSYLYQQNHLSGFQDWANRYGMLYRMQPYGLTTDSLYFASFLDIPEGETLGFKNLDDYRVLCGGRDLAGHVLLSCESLAILNGAYSTTWHQGLEIMAGAYVAGVNQTVIHGFAYADAPGATWPGFAAWSPYEETEIGYSEAWGPRQPTWRHMPDIAAYMSRLQWAMRTGKAQYDLVFFRQKGYTSTGIGADWGTSDGIPIGWTYTFATTPVLGLQGVTVKDGVLAPDGPAIAAMVLTPDFFDSSTSEIDPEGARLLLDFAKAGLPTVVYGDWSDAVSTGLVPAQVNDEVAATITELLALGSVVNVTDENDIGDALAQLGVTPRVSYASSAGLKTLHRVDGKVDIYLVANAQHDSKIVITPVDQIAWFTAQVRDAVPYQLDLWTGEISRIAQFTRQGSQVGVQVTLNPGETTVVVLAAPGWAGEHGATQVTQTTADAVFTDGGQVVVRASAGGDYTATLADGTVLQAVVGSVPAPVTLGSWTLEAEDWQPGATATQTLKPVVSVALDALTAWTAIPELENSSGVGHYRTTVTLPQSWNRGLGATLSLGTVNDTFRVRVNGQLVPPAGILASAIDLGGLLRPGPNTIEVEVATTLINRLRVVTPAIYGPAKPQAYGLLGPVQLTPYGQAVAR
ncbi:MAG: glycosyl hydrolase [Trebonia sp.]